VAEQPVRAGHRVWTQPVTDVDGQHDPAVGGAVQRQPSQPHPQPSDIDTPGVDRVVQGAVPAAVLGGKRQPGQAGHRPVSAQHRVDQLEQRIRPSIQAPVEVPPEPSQPRSRVLDSVGRGRVGQPQPAQVVHNRGHGHRLSFSPCREPKDHQTVAGLRPDDTPNPQRIIWRTETPEVKEQA
jgi:hypothetical protein